jgi:hypothetical protein
VVPAPPVRAQLERPIESSVAGDLYGLYVEVRRVGHLARTKDVQAALELLRLSGESPRELSEFVDFVTANADALDEARVVVTGLNARADVPEALIAVQFLSPEAASAFEPKLRAFFNDPTYVEPGTSARRGKRRPKRQKSSAPPLIVKRAGSWLYLSEKPFTFKSLRGDGSNFIANNVRLQSYRSRFATESVFFFYDWDLLKKNLQMQTEMAKSSAGVEVHPPPVPTVSTTEMEPAVKATPDSPATAEGEGEAATPMAVEGKGETEATIVGEPEPSTTPGEKPKPVISVRAPTAEERAAQTLVSVLMRGLFDGGLMEPAAIGVGVAIEGDHIAARVLVANEERAVPLIPFFRNIVSGPEFTPESLSVAPSDSEIFVTASFDWLQIYDTLILGLEKKAAAAVSIGVSDGTVTEGAEGKNADGEAKQEGSEQEIETASAGKSIEAMEKLLGYKIKEDLLGAFDNEVAISLPADFFEGGSRGRLIATLAEQPGQEKFAKAGAVVILTLKNPEMVKKAMPLLLAAIGQLGQPQIEKRKGYDIQELSGIGYAFINNFLVVGQDMPAVRYVVDSNAANQTLVTSTTFRDSIAWQKQQRLALAYVSDSLMRSWIASTKKMAVGSSDPVVLGALNYLDEPPSTVSYAATHEGDAVLHELRVPIGLLKVFSASTLIGQKEAPNTTNEMMAMMTLRELAGAEEMFKNARTGGVYGTVEELQEAKVLEKGFENTKEYTFEVRASGEKFTVTATPKNYGKAGRRSFFLDETSVLRGADHKGEPATSADPQVDQ